MITLKKTCLFLFFILLVFIQSCSKYSDIYGITYTAGICLYPEDLKKIKTGIYQTEVFNTLGSPTFVNSFNKNIWYYVYQKTWYIATLTEKLIYQEILILHFDNEGILVNIESKNLKDSMIFKYDKSNTKFYYKKNYIKPELFN